MEINLVIFWKFKKLNEIINLDAKNKVKATFLFILLFFRNSNNLLDYYRPVLCNPDLAI